MWNDRGHMMLLLLISLTAITGLFYYAAAVRNHGSVWADQLCAQTVILCDQPHWLLIALSAVVIVGMVQTMGRA